MDLMAVSAFYYKASIQQYQEWLMVEKRRMPLSRPARVTKLWSVLRVRVSEAG